MPINIKDSIESSTIKGSLNGNASTATKATQDSAGQQINKTYIKGLSVSGKTITYTKGDGTTGTITTQDTDTKYTHPSYTAKSSGLYKVTIDSTGHVSATAAVTKDDITALGIPGSDTNTTYSNMKGATSSAAGASGLVPAPAAGKQASFLRGDGTWVVPTNTTYSAVTTSTNGLMTAADKTKLDGIATGANAYSHPTSAGNKHVPSGGASGNLLGWSSDGTAKWVSGAYLPLSGGDMTASISIANGYGFNIKTGSDITATDGTTVPAGTKLSMMYYNSSHNLHIGYGIYDKKIGTGSLYISAPNHSYFRTNQTSGNFYFQFAGTSKVTISSGGITAGTFTGALSGNASTATKLATARTIKVGNTGKSFDGSGGITFTLAEVGIVSGTSAPSNSDGRADGTVYFRYA